MKPMSLFEYIYLHSSGLPRPGRVAGTAEAGSGGGEEEEVSASARNNRYSATIS